MQVIAFLLALLVFIAIYIGFPILFGETPVNVLYISSSSGIKNLVLNLLFYSLLTITISTLPAVFLKNRVIWFQSVITGLALSLIAASLFSLLSFDK
ncbi:hypothetical protein CIG75_00910 [Tumebacillus algifaecis]|uniref:Uncharacterized protein n=1 Tax=Tumebacillus algifaecis TaxID=1214604 RepID=A0A223CWR6_9BACL|nr:hypothetical protein [Tumebacillus algifaecis]ASS73675.1 hypothetical protein CIG75_00910 [Tumebacillus algifaecis]